MAGAGDELEAGTGDGGNEVVAIRRVHKAVLLTPDDECLGAHPVQALAQTLVRQRPDELEDAGHRHRRPQQ